MDHSTKSQTAVAARRRTTSVSSVQTRMPSTHIGAELGAIYQGDNDSQDMMREEHDYNGAPLSQGNIHYVHTAQNTEPVSPFEQLPQQTSQTMGKPRRRRPSLRNVALLGRSSSIQSERRPVNSKPVPSSAVSAAAAATSSSTLSAPLPPGPGTSFDASSGLGISNLVGSSEHISSRNSGLGVTDITPRPSMEGYASRAASAAVAAALLSPTSKSSKQSSKLLPRAGDGGDESGTLSTNSPNATAVMGSSSVPRRHDRRRSSSGTVNPPSTNRTALKVPPTAAAGSCSTMEEERNLYAAAPGSKGALNGGGGTHTGTTLSGPGAMASGVVSNTAAAAAAAATSLLRADPRLGGVNATAVPDAYMTGGDSSVSSGRPIFQAPPFLQQRRGGSGPGAQLLQQQQQQPQQQQSQSQSQLGRLPPPQALQKPLHQRRLSQSYLQQQQKHPQLQDQIQNQHQNQNQQQNLPSAPNQSPLLQHTKQQQRHHQHQHQRVHQNYQLVQQPPPPKQRAKSPLALTDLVNTDTSTTLQQPLSPSATTTAEVGGSAGSATDMGVGVSVGVVGVGVNVTVNVGGDPDWDYAETAWWGWLMLIVTWVVFVVGMGSCLGVWSWAWDVGKTPYAPPELEDDPTLPIVGYYPALLILTCVMAWVWVVVAWIGMKYFRHAKISGD
ncbi:MAG: hypothetical protein SEPTF4163_001624 [Sporothrix epigloea]